MRFSLGATLAYEIEQPTPFVFNVEAATCERQAVVAESLTFSQPLDPDRFRMPETGNRYVRVTAQPGPLTVEYRGEIDLDPIVDDPASITEIGPTGLPLETFPHLNPSRYCQSDKLQRFAHRQFGTLALGHQRVTAVCNWIHDNVDYVSGSTDALTSAFDIVTERSGVCRDFAHLSIALCRALGIPSRYVSAYAWQLTPPDFHAAMECFLHGPSGPRWYLFDATRKAALDGLVRIGVGRDAADVPFAAPFGSCRTEPPRVWIDGQGPAEPGLTVQAISLSTA